MVQRVLAFAVMCWLLASGAALAEPPPPEQRYLNARDCLQRADIPCTKVALAGINPASPYARLLEAELATTQQDFDSVLRLILPLENESGLIPEATASLHATLATAYEKLDNPLRALEQRVRLLESTDPSRDTLDRLWTGLVGLPRERLLEMRGESPDSTVQGWVDLALARHAADPLAASAHWQHAYPEHAATPLLAELLQRPAPARTSTPSPHGAVAVLLPLEHPEHATATRALLAGLQAAQATATAVADLRILPVSGAPEDFVPAYHAAIAAGARQVIGPWTQDEVSALMAASAVTVPTLAFSRPATHGALPAGLMLFGRPAEAEAFQLADIGRHLGMRSAIVVAATTPEAERLAESFMAAWEAQDGILAHVGRFTADAPENALQHRGAADLVFIAGNADAVRHIRPWLDPAIPVFTTSDVHETGQTQQAALNAIHFVDMPWLIQPDDPAFAPYARMDIPLQDHEARRWVAVGVDAWHVLGAGATETYAPLHGLSGHIHWEDGQPVRELATAQFRDGAATVETLR